jgi:hypothetical protein
MATTETRQHFVNNYGCDIVVAYLNLPTGGYNSAIFNVCDEVGWAQAVLQLRDAACFFKLPMNASAAVDIVVDSDKSVPTSFFVEIHRSEHIKGTRCSDPQLVTKEAGENALKLAKQLLQALTDATEVLIAEPLSTTRLMKVLGTTCASPDPCDGAPPCDCPKPLTTHAECINGEYQCVPNGS